MIRPILTYFLFLTFFTGLVYPFFITGISQLVFPYHANGSLLYNDNTPIGSKFIGQKFSQDKYFWSRPSASDYNTLPSSGSNLSPSNKKFLKTVSDRFEALKKAHADKEPPADLVYASASGLDPEITVAAALYQVNRVAKARNLTDDQLAKLIEYIESSKHVYWRVTPYHYLNLLRLNLTLDQLQEDVPKTNP